MDRLATMMTFQKVVKYANFTTAADDLGISRTLVSRHVADLEAYLGIRLLNRTTRSVTPTEALSRAVQPRAGRHPPWRGGNHRDQE
jgi:DNA-binding transcriptional LysR family regulator